MTARTRPLESRTPASVPLPQLADKSDSSASGNASRFTQPPTQTGIFATPSNPRPDVRPDRPTTKPHLPTIASIKPSDTNPPSRFSSSLNSQPSNASQTVLSEAPNIKQPPPIKPSGTASIEKYRAELH